MKVLLIGMQERVMRDLATSLQAQGHTVTSSEEITPDLTGQAIEQVIVGRQVPPDHPVLREARQQGLTVCAYAEFIYTYAQDKQRIVMTGEEKNLTFLLASHVLKQLRKPFDYVFNAPALATSVRLSDAPIILLEGDALPSSSTDPEPLSLRYQHHILMLGAMHWEASEPYPTLEAYQQYVTRLADASPKSSTLIHSKEDTLTQKIVSVPRADVKVETYGTHPHRQEGTQTYLVTPKGDVPFPVADPASMRAVAAAHQLASHLAITDQLFYDALATFRVDHLT